MGRLQRSQRTQFGGTDAAGKAWSLARSRHDRGGDRRRQYWTDGGSRSPSRKVQPTRSSSAGAKSPTDSKVAEAAKPSARSPLLPCPRWAATVSGSATSSREPVPPRQPVADLQRPRDEAKLAIRYLGDDLPSRSVSTAFTGWAPTPPPHARRRDRQVDSDSEFLLDLNFVAKITTTR